MSNGRRRAPIAGPAAALLGLAVFGALPARAAEPRFPVLPEWRNTAQQVAQAGVPLSELAPNAPDSHTVQKGDTLWDISKLFLKSPWRWPELWGMNLDQIRNPHLIYPGQVLVLVKTGDRATLRVAQPGSGVPGNTVKLSPRIRSNTLDGGAVASVPLHLIGPFLDQAVVFNAGELDNAPRVVATQEGRVMVSRGETAYVRGDPAGARDFRVFREPKALIDPETKEVLGYEGRYVGTAELVRPADDGGGGAVVPATFTMTSAKIEAAPGDRLSPVPQSELAAYVPHAPSVPTQGRIVGVYGEGLLAGQNQIVSINRGARDGIERGHVLALWRAGAPAIDKTVAERTPMRLPDERHGLLFVFSVFDRVSYALVLSVKDPVRSGDRFTQP